MTDKEKNSSDANNSHDEGDLLADPDAHLSLEEKEEVVCDPPSRHLQNSKQLTPCPSIQDRKLIRKLDFMLIPWVRCHDPSPSVGKSHRP